MGVGRSHLLKEQAEIMSQVTEPAIRAHGKEAGGPSVQAEESVYTS